MFNRTGIWIPQLSVLFLGALAATGGYADTATYSAVNDFSVYNNPNGPWSYGWEQPLGVGFALLYKTNTEGVPGMQARSAGLDYPFWYATPYVAHNITSQLIQAYGFAVPPNKLQMHPGGGSYVVVRWTSPFKTATTVHLEGGFSALDATADADVHVLAAGAAAFDAIVTPGNDASFEKDIAISPGGTIDFVVGSHGNYNGDSIGLQATITPPPDPGPTITPNGVTSGATFASGAIAPGEIIAIFGSGIGPDLPASLALDSNGMVSSNIGQTRVRVGGVLAPLIYAQSKQIVAIAPYSIAAGSSTSVQVEYLGQMSNSVAVPVVAAAPAFFTRDSSGKGQVIAIDLHGRLLGTDNPAKPGSTITLWATGEGLTTPGGVDGRPAAAVNPWPVPALPVSVTIDGMEASVSYCGGAPGMVAGVMQINLTIPKVVSLGDKIPIVLRVGTVSSPADATLAIR